LLAVFDWESRGLREPDAGVEVGSAAARLNAAASVSGSVPI